MGLLSMVGTKEFTRHRPQWVLTIAGNIIEEQ